MLVFSRHVDDRIMIGNTIEICVVRIQQDKVYIGIEAPPETPVHRGEIYRKIQAGEEPKT